MKMFVRTETIEDIVYKGASCPFPHEVLTNNMGINLVSVDSITWLEREDGQLVYLTIHFIPSET